MISRRKFLAGTGIAGCSLAAPHIGRSAVDLQERSGARPQRIIHIVSDGMSAGTISCADMLSHLTRKKGLTWLKLQSEPGARAGFMNMRSLNSLVTDSSAASSAWGSGSLIMNGAVNMLPDGQWLKPIYSLFGDAGWARGLVTTTEITHATPAGFAANAWSRDSVQTIAAQYFDRRVEVLLGGGSPFFDPKRRRDKRDLKQEFLKEGYAVVTDLATLEKAPAGDRLLGLFASGHLPYTIDQQQDARLQARVPTLAAMTRAALERLERSNRFILQVEGGRVDHAAHNCDAASALYDQIALDEAIDVCVEFQRRNPETLLVLTTDHGNANFGLNGTGAGYGQSSPRFAFVQQVKASFPIMLDRMKKLGTKIEAQVTPRDRDDVVVEKRAPYVVKDRDSLPLDAPQPKEEAKKVEEQLATTSAYEVSPKVIADVIGDATGFKVSARRAQMFARAMAGEPMSVYDQMTSVTAQLGLLMANRTAMSFIGGAHTGDYVPVLALGPGADRFHGFIQSTDIFAHYLDLAGIRFSNPTLPLVAEGGMEAAAVERVASYATAAEPVA